MRSSVEKFKYEALLAQGYMPGTLASYLAVAQQSFFNRASALIKRVARDRADTILVMRDKGDISASLVYKGKNEDGKPMNFSIYIDMKTFPETTLRWEGKSESVGRFNGKQMFKASRLRPDDVMVIFRRYFEAK